MSNIKIVYEETNKSINMARHFHNLYEIIFISEGSASFLINSKKYTANAGNIIFISHLESHELTVNCYPYKRYYIMIEPNILHTMLPDNRLTSILKNRPEGFNHVIKLDSNEIAETKDIFDNIACEYCNSLDFSDINISALLQLLFIKLFRGHGESFPVKSLSGASGVVNDVQRYIDLHFIEPINLKDISAKFYLDIFYLSHLFKKVCGYSMKDYLILQRISKAKELLVRRNSSVAEICAASGFGNLNHFIRIFKKKEGLTPLQYRKSFSHEVLPS